MDISQQLRRHRVAWLSGKVWRGRMVFATGAVAIGIAAVIFAKSADIAGGGFEQLRARWPLLPLLLTPFGFAALAWITKRWFPGAEGSGIPQAIAARRTRDVAYRRRLLGIRLTLGKIILTVAGLAIGASIGREGPTVQVGASIMLMVAGVAGIGATRGLVLAGGAAGVAAAFNTPLAGVVFAIEEMAKAFEHRFSGPILGAVVLAGLTGIALIGDYRYFGHASTHLAVAQDWLAVPVCGIVCGTLGGLFSLGVLRVATARKGLLATRRTHTVLFAFACGVLVAWLGWLTDGYAHGTSYDVTRGLIDGGAGPVFWAAPLKLVATLASSVSGIPGGLFAPSLSVGAGLGPALGHVLPDMDLRALSLLAMVGYFAGVVQAPLTAFVIVLEMIDDSRMVVPLMATALLATGASRLVCPHSLYHTLSRFYDRGAAESTETTPREASHP